MSRTKKNSYLGKASLIGAVLIALQVFGPSSPLSASCSVTQQGSFAMSQTALDLEVSGSYAYVVEHGYALRVVDVSNPSPTSRTSRVSS